MQVILTIWNIIPSDSFIKVIKFDLFETLINWFGATKSVVETNSHQPMGMYADFGYTCGMSLSRKNHKDGVPWPVVKTGTETIKDLFSIGILVVDEMQPLFLEGNEAWKDPACPERMFQYAGTIFKGNCAKALQIAKTLLIN